MCMAEKKWLAAGIAALLISGTGAVSDVLAAPVYTSGITTKAKKDKATFGSAYKVENGVNKYNLEDGSKISIHGTYHAEGITPGKGTTSVVTVGDGTGTLSIDTSSSEAGNSQGAGILASDGSRLTINGNLQIKTYGGSCFADGIYMMRAGTGTGAKSEHYCQRQRIYRGSGSRWRTSGFLFPGREMGSQCGGNTWRLRAGRPCSGMGG